MAIDYDDLWIPGAVRIRASAPDRYAGLRGHAYIEARGLGVAHVQRLDAFDKAATVQRLDTEQRAAAAQEAGANLIANLRLVDPVKQRRFFVISTPKRTAR